MVDEEIKEQEVEVQEPKKRKYGWVGMILLFVFIGLGIYSMFKIVDLLPGDISDIGTVFSNIDYRFFVLSILLAILIPVLVTIEYSIVNHSITRKISPKAITKTTFVGKYYDFVTPFSTGGQPMQIYTLHKHGFDGATSSAIILIRYAVNIVCWLIVGLVLMITGFFCGVLGTLENEASRTFLMTAGIVGICLNLLLPLAVLLFVVFPKIANGLTRFIIKIGAKIRIVKDPEKAYKKAYKTVNDFRMCFKTISQRPGHFVLLILVSVIEHLVTFSLPFFVIMALKNTVDWSKIFDVSVLNVFSTFAVSFIPTPGNAGGMEISSALAFQAVAPEVSVYAVLIWRFFTYYIYILIGIIITIYDLIKKAIRAAKEKRLAKAGEAAVEENNSEKIEKK